MEPCCLSFFLSPTLRFASHGISIGYDGETLTVSLTYSFRDAALTLAAKAAPTDRVVLTFRPYRVELFVSGKLEDEEWPCGDPLFDKSDLSLLGTVGALNESDEPLPAVLGSFENAEGWRPGGGIFTGDCMPYEEDGRFHLLYLKDRRHHQSKWKLGAHQWEHLSTADLKHWDIHPTAVAIDDPMEGSICTGSWMKNGDTRYLYYTVRMADHSPAPIRRSVSTDGVHFEKDRSFGFTLSEAFHQASARDPKVIRADDGWHMFVTTSAAATGKGALAHLFSTDGEQWSERGTVYEAADGTQPECPDYFFFAGHYYLTFGLHGQSHYLVSTEPFSGWREPADPIIPCGNVPKAAVHNGRLIFAGFVCMGGYAGVLTFREAFADADGTLWFRLLEA